ncbi:MAG: response regulator [Bacteroidetes bacterium]|nr:response regulator [Bacteroidota bacterium]MBU1115614.1 response regulator [Bacteroidota bacterium]MBU1799253.1 response regulator [Bacteroidota bacterium]
MSTNARKILVIEDDLDLLNNINEILGEEGFSVKTESDGMNGIKTAYTWLPDLIICDISIPIKNGYDVLQAILNSEKTKTIPFIFLTSKVEKEDIRKGMRLGADDYLFKPFDLDDLLLSINMRLEKKNVRITNTSQEVEDQNKIYEIDDKLLLKNGPKMQFHSIRDLKYLRAESPYVNLKFANGYHSLERKSMDEWEAKLPCKYFIRIHRSTIINIEFITKIEKLNNTSYLIKLKDEKESFVISKRYSAKLKSHFS